MHELAVCQALIQQVTSVAAEHGAGSAERIVVSVGPLSGVEPALLASAFTVAREGSVASGAELTIQTAAIELACRACGHHGPGQPSRLICGACGDWRVRVTKGEELMLLSVELGREHAPMQGSGDASREGLAHV